MIGAHVDIGEGLVEAAVKVHSAGGNIIQIMFTKNMTMIRRSNDELIELRDYLKEYNMEAVVHSSYYHNLCRNWDEHSWWLINFELEIKYAHLINAKYIVVHFGKQKGRDHDVSLAEAYNNMYSALLYIHRKTTKYNNVQILLETPTGQGSEICYKIEDLAYFYKKISKSQNKEFKNRIKLCIDTCHIFSAGYDLRTKTKCKMYLEAFEELIGLHYVKLVHFNDSKVDVGCKKDRHESIGKGKIGMIGLKYLFKQFNLLNIPMILETPGDSYLHEIKLLT